MFKQKEIQMLLDGLDALAEKDKQLANSTIMSGRMISLLGDRPHSDEFVEFKAGIEEISKVFSREIILLKAKAVNELESNVESPVQEALEGES